MNTFNLLGDIVQDDSQKWFESDVVPAMVIGWLAKQDGDVEININSLGGSVTGGLAIANAIKGYAKGKVTANVLGIAASMASVVACAADEIKMGKGAFLMVHNPWSMAMGEAEDLRKEADILDQMKDAIIGFYQSKFDRAPEELAALMDAETWIESGHEAEYGLAATETEEGAGMKAAAKCDTRMMFAHAPEAAAAYYAHKERPAPKAPAPVDWEARFKGLQAAKDKEIAALRDELAAAEERHKTALDEAEANHQAAMAAKCEEVAAATADAARAESSTTIESLNADIAEKAQALDAAKADAEQLRAKLAEAEKALADTQAALAAETERYREQIGLALAPAEELRTAAEIARDPSLSPAERSRLLAEGKYAK